MKKIILSLMAFLVVTACATRDKEIMSESERAHRDAAWAEVDVDNLDATQMSKAFEQATESTVYFGFNNAYLTPQSVDVLTRQAQWLNAHPNAYIAIEGHCDERGTREYNLALGEARAMEIKNFLIRQGVAPKRIRTISYGKERPIAFGSNEEAWAKNRRGVTVVF